MTMRKIGYYSAVYILLILSFAFLLVPIIWVFLASLTEPRQITSGSLWPGLRSLTLDSYTRTLGSADVRVHLRNSFVIASMTTIATLLIATLAAYSTSRFARISGASITVVVLSQMFPYVLLMIPFYQLALQFNALDSYASIVFTHVVVALPFSFWMLKSYFDNVPRDLDEAALIDGCNYISLLYRVILPCAAPGLVVVAFFAFVSSWGEYMFASILSQSKQTATITVLLQGYISGRRIEWGLVSASTILSIAPTVILFALTQRWLVAGLMSGAVKE